MSSSQSSTSISADQLLRESERVQRLVYGLVGNTAVADDILQEAWVRALEKPPKQNLAPGGWFARVARNLAVDWLRREGKHSRRREHSDPDRVEASHLEIDPQAKATQAELNYMLINAVKNLSDPYRTVISLHYFEGFTVSEVARETGVTGSTVRTQLMRGRERLEGALNRSLGQHWQARLLMAFPMVKPLIPNSDSIVAGAGGGSSAQPVAFPGGFKSLLAFGTLLLVSLTTLWFVLPDPAENFVVDEVSVAGSTLPFQQQGQLGRSESREDPSAGDIGSSAVAFSVIDPNALLSGDLSVQAVRLGQRLEGAVWDAPLEALTVIERFPVEVANDSIQVPRHFRDDHWFLELSAPGIATQRMHPAQVESLENRWQPVEARSERFQVRDFGGVGLAGAYVWIGARSKGGNFPVQLAVSDAEGYVEFDNLPNKQLRVVVVHPDGGFTSLTENEIRRISKPIGEAIVELNVDSPGGVGMTPQRLYASAFPFGSGAAHYSSFLLLAANFLMRQDRLNVLALENGDGTKNAAQPYTLSANFYGDDFSLRGAQVVVEFESRRHGQVRLGADGNLQLSASEPFRRIAVISENGFFRADEILTHPDDPFLFDLGSQPLHAYPHADVKLIGVKDLPELTGGLSEPVLPLKKGRGPLVPHVAWASVLLQSSQWLNPQRLAADSLRFRAPGEDLLGTAWVQAGDRFPHSVKLIPRSLLEVAIRQRATVTVIGDAPMGKPGDKFCLMANEPFQLFTGVRPDGSIKRIVAELQEDGRTVVFHDVPDDNYSLDTYPVAKQPFTLTSFVVPKGEHVVVHLPVRQSGALTIQVPLEWRGNAWCRLTSLNDIGNRAPHNTKRTPFNWEGVMKYSLLEGEYELLVQLGELPPMWKKVTITPNSDQIVRFDPELAHYPVRVESNDIHQCKRIVLIYRGHSRSKWIRRRGKHDLPAGGVFATGRGLTMEMIGGLAKVGAEAREFDLRIKPEGNLHAFVLDQNGVWSDLVVLKPAQFVADREVVIRPTWSPTIILDHPRDWGRWNDVRLVGDAITDQELDLAAAETDLPLARTGEVRITLVFSNSSGESIQVEQATMVDPNETEPIRLPIQVPK